MAFVASCSNTISEILLDFIAAVYFVGRGSREMDALGNKADSRQPEIKKGRSRYVGSDLL